MATGDHISNDYSRADNNYSCGGMASYGGSYGGDYGSYSGPCFAGECQLLLEDGNKVALQELKRGMKVVTPKGTREVGAVVRTVIEGGRLMMCRIGELKVTPWHPIRIEGKWVFPADVVEAQLEECDAVYSALLEADIDVDAHAFEVEGVTAVTLGHGLVASSGAAEQTFERTHSLGHTPKSWVVSGISLGLRARTGLHTALECAGILWV